MSTYKEKDKAYVDTVLMVVDIMISLLFELIGDMEDTMFMTKHGVVYEPLAVIRGEYYRLLTPVFLHFGTSHLMNNMLVLFVLGERTGQALGHERYLFFYMASGIFVNVISIVVYMEKGYAVVSAGVSGAIFGVVGDPVCAVAVNHGQLDGLTNRRLGLMILLTLYHGFMATGIGSQAHIGGLIPGFILSILLYRRPRVARGFYVEEQKQSYADHSRRRAFDTTDDSCILCRIADGVIPSATPYGDEQFRMILDSGPASKGHILILPRQHFADVCTLNEETASRVFPLGAKISAAMKRFLDCIGSSLIQNDGGSAGQAILHFHVHVIPRYENGPSIVGWISDNATPGELTQTAEQARNGLQGLIEYG